MKYIYLVFLIVFIWCSGDTWSKELETENEIEVFTDEELVEYNPEDITYNFLYQKYNSQVKNDNFNQEIFSRIFTEFNTPTEWILDLRNMNYRDVSFFQDEWRDDKIFLSILNNIDTFDYSEFNTSQQLLNSKVSESWDYTVDNGMFFWNYNPTKNYLYSLDTAYEMIWMCNLVVGDINNFIDFRWETASLEDSNISLEDFIDRRLDELNSEISSSTTYENIKSWNANSINSELALILIAQEYQNSTNLRQEIIEIFFSEFDKRLSIDTSYNDFSLYVLMKREQWDTTLCDNLFTDFFKK